MPFFFCCSISITCIPGADNKPELNFKTHKEISIGKELCSLGHRKQGFCMADGRYRSWPAILCISVVHPGGKLHCSLKNNRQPWECTEMKGQDKACQKITFPLNY